MVPLRNRSKQKVFKYGTPEPSLRYTALIKGYWSLRSTRGLQGPSRARALQLWGYRSEALHLLKLWGLGFRVLRVFRVLRALRVYRVYGVYRVFRV